MGMLILLIAFFVEVSFVTYCVITKSTQEKVKSYLRVGALATFILFTLASVIKWSFRWYLFFTLLLIWALLGIWTLLRRPVENKGYRLFTGLLKAFLMLLLVAVAVLPALIFPQIQLPKVTGNHAVATALFTYTNENQIDTFNNSGQKRKVNVEFWYPADSVAGERYPLVVFSHGSMGMKTSNTSTFEELASHGYVVCAIDHPYHAMFTRTTDGQVFIVSPTFRQQLYDVNNGKYDPVTALQLERSWMTVQTTDISFVLDTILANSKDPVAPAVYQRIDETKIGLFGHSLGGVASAEVARERQDIDAVVNLDADLFGEYTGVVDGQDILNKAPYPVPILTFLSDDLSQRIAAIPDADERVAIQYISTTNPKAYEVVIPGTNHMSFTDLQLISPFLANLLDSSAHSTRGSGADPLATLENMNAKILQFYDVYLKGEGSFAVTK
jgi:predicted dienelactone hydrolase